MAPREKLTMAGLCLTAFAASIYALIIWGGFDVRGTVYEWLGFLIGFGAAGFGLALGIVSASERAEDEREILIGLKAERVALRVVFLGLMLLFVTSGGVFGPVPGGAMLFLVMVGFATTAAARLFYYRREL